MGLNATYKMDHSVPCNLTEADYRTHVMEKWDKVLNAPATDEKALQKFMEEHPCLMPFTERPLTQGNNHPLSDAVVTQPELAGLKKKVPDFLYFTGSSAEITAVLVEIESPTKKWFTKKGDPTAELTQAANQITSWKAWFDDPVNVLNFERDYLVRDYGNLNDRVFRQEYILVIGRRRDLTDPNLNRARSKLQREAETWMTYDRLNWSSEFLDAVTVRLERSGPTPQFQIKHVPPTIKLGPCQYPNYHRLVGLDDAISSNALIAQQRKQFLLNRIPYWRQWHTSHKGLVTISGADVAGE